MKVARLVLLAVFLVQSTAIGADGSISGAASKSLIAAKETGKADTPNVNLVAFVGRKLEARYVEPKKGEVPFDAEYFLRYEVLQVVFGNYTEKEIAFSSYVHVGEPEFKKHTFGLVYVSEYKGRYVQQKYLFQAVYPTADGRWAGCGGPYARGMSGSGVKPEPIAFKPPVVFKVGELPDFQVEREFPPPMFRRKGGTVICEMGNYPNELFRVMKESYLTARGVFRSPLR